MTSRSIREYTAIPIPSDLLLAVEVSDSTLHVDLAVQAKLYVRADIQEYWVVNNPDQQLVVHRQPANGVYSNVMLPIRKWRRLPRPAISFA